MKLLRVEVEHFACLKKTAVEFGPGLNVLYGPNDLGKSTLARAIRAVLLIQHSSKVANAFREWDSDENPFVKLTIELADGRIWRVEKRFGTTGGSSMLRESNDGVHFSPFRRSREVDDEVRTRLGWGIAAPATKNAPKGLPPSFLATVLLGEQTDVAGVLRQTLDADSDESGRKKLTAALAAFAQDPLFKSILDRAQARVDEAFTTKGNKKTGRTSPFREVTDEVKRSKQLLDELKSRVDESEAVQRTLSERQDDLVDAHDALDGAIAHRDTLKRMAEQLATRKGIEEALAVAQKTFAENEAELDGLADRRKQLVDAETLASKLERRVGELENERQSLVGAKTAAEDALRRAKSDEAEHDRQLRRGELDNKRLELEAELKDLTTAHERAVKASEYLEKLRKTDQDRKEAEVAHKASHTEIERANVAIKQLSAELDLLEVASRLLERRENTASIEELETIRAEVDADRAVISERLATAEDMRSRLAQHLPEPDELDRMLKLKQELDVAEAGLGGGVSIGVERRKPVALRAQADGAPIELADDGDIAFEAARRLELDVGDFAKITVVAGDRDSRLKAEALRRHWDEEVVAVLTELGVVDLDALRQLVDANEDLEQKIKEAETAAKNIEERAALRQQSLGKLDSLVKERDALDRELEGKPCADAEMVLERLDGRPLREHEKHLRSRRSEAEHSRQTAVDTGHQAASSARVLDERAETLRADLDKLGACPHEKGWQAHASKVVARIEEIRQHLIVVKQEADSLAAEQNVEVSSAEAALANIKTKLTGIVAKLELESENLDSHKRAADKLRGEIDAREAAVARIDIEAAQRVVADIEKNLATLPKPDRDVTSDELKEADDAVVAAMREVDGAKDRVRKAEGALETVGGQVVLEQKETAEEALRLAEDNERLVEVEYDAWRLLAEKLREAENTEGQHLGEALGQPVTERFAELTAERYGKLAVAPNLGAIGLEVDGVLRDIASLSVGTQEQLATLLRLTVAEHLESPLLLDDHLTQSDPARSAWFRNVLRAHASKSQVIVLTCRPDDYLSADDLPDEGEESVNRAAGLVRVVKLSSAIHRGGSSAQS